MTVSMAGEGERALRFGDAELDPVALCLRIRGAPVHLSPRALCILLYLARHRDRVVGKGELLETFWPDAKVTENSLAQEVRQLRRAFGSAAAPIAAVYRQGYRFTAALSGDSPETASSFAGRPMLAVAALGGRRADAYLAEGVAGDLAARLASWRWFPVMSPNSFAPEAAGRRAVLESARGSGARYLVLAGLHRDASRVRVDAQLVDLASGRGIARERREGDFEKLLAHQAGIAEALIAALHPELLRSELNRMTRPAAPSFGAWDSFVRGLWHLWRYTRADNELARTHFAEAARRDPSFASPLGFTALSHLNDANARWTSSPGYSIGQALAAAEAGVRLDPTDPWCEAMLGGIFAVVGRREQAVTALESAITRNPSFALSYWALGRGLSIWGRARESLALFEQAIRLSPRDPFAAHFHEGRGFAHYFLREWETAADAARRSISLRDDWPRAHLLLAASLAQLGRAGEARIALRGLRRLDGQFTYEALRASYAYANAEPGIVESLIAGLERAGWEERVTARQA